MFSVAGSEAAGRMKRAGGYLKRKGRLPTQYSIARTLRLAGTIYEAVYAETRTAFCSIRFARH